MSNTHAPFARRVVAFVLLVIASIVAMAAPATATKRFEISAGPAESTLKQFSAQSGVQLVFPTDRTQGVRTNAVRGAFTPREALERMLAGTPLVVVSDPETGALGVKPADTTNGAEKNGASRPADSRAAVPKADHADADSVLMLQSIEVRSPRDEGYRSTHTVSGSRTVEALRDTPTSISILNRELMDDLNVVNVNEIAAFGVAGEQQDNNDALSAAHVFRGQVSLITLRNGVPWLQWVDSHSIERLEVLRGPQAFLYGESSPVGVMNYVTKQAQSNDFQRATLMTGSDGLIRGELDVNRKLRPNFAARVSLAYHRSDSFIHHASRDFRGMYSAINYKPFKHTTLTASAEYGRNFLIQPSNLLADQFTNGATLVYTLAQSGYTYVPATGEFFAPPASGEPPALGSRSPTPASCRWSIVFPGRTASTIIIIRRSTWQGSNGSARTCSSRSAVQSRRISAISCKKPAQTPAAFLETPIPRGRTERRIRISTSFSPSINCAGRRSRSQPATRG
jgi:outer membrane receptor protein involved in Fe transport